jgi:hypothetical protein
MIARRDRAEFLSKTVQVDDERPLSQRKHGDIIRGALNLCDCARTVHESHVFIQFELSLSEKQIPRFVGNVSS